MNVLPRPGSLSSLNLAAVRIDHVLHRREADAGAADAPGRRGPAPHELAEDGALLVALDARARDR